MFSNGLLKMIFAIYFVTKIRHFRVLITATILKVIIIQLLLSLVNPSNVRNFVIEQNKDFREGLPVKD